MLPPHARGEKVSLEHYRRHPTPFFKRQRTNRLIDQLAKAKKLTIYAGAGVTVDQGGLSWSQLVHHVAMSTVVRANDIITDIDLRMLGSAMSPLEAATAILQHFQKATGGNLAQSEANNALVSCLSYSLYPGARWNAGELARGIATVTLTRAINDLPTRIVTTNYDTLLEDAIAEQRESAANSFKKFGMSESVPPLNTYLLEQTIPDDDVLSFVYLHGRISASPDDAVQGTVAFTEIDYARVRPTVSEFLRENFRRSPLLIVGASLTDPPLIAALQDTIPASGNTESRTVYHRVALLPIPAIQTQTPIALDAEETKSLSKQHVARMKTLGVELLVPDFYSSVSQFTDEIDCATYRQLWGAERANTIFSPYWERLSEWWQNWYQYRYQNRTRRRALDTYLRLFLSDLEDDILETTGRKEHLKVDLWAIWDPSQPHRAMKLWASSSWPRSQWDATDIAYLEETARAAEITRQSDYPAVRALIEGRPLLTDVGELVDTSSHDNPHVSRWRTSLAVPITVYVGSGRNAVGAVTLASMVPDSLLNPSEPALLDKCVRRMRHIGEMSLGVKRDRYRA